MIKQLNPIVPLSVMPIEIDRAIIDLQYKLETNLSWLTNAYGRSYRFQRLENEKRVYYPEIYIGVKGGAPQYYRVTPDGFKKGSCFFIANKEEINDFSLNASNVLEFELSIVFQVNLDLINRSLLGTEVFTQNLIADVRNVLTKEMNGTFYQFKLESIEREFNRVYKEFSLDELRNYNMAPYDNFRINGMVTMYQDCNNTAPNVCDILTQNISESEIITCLLPTLDFSKPEVFGALTQTQIDALIIQIGN